MISRNQLGADLLAMPPMDAAFPNTIGFIAAGIYGLLALSLVLWGLRKKDSRLIIAAMLFGGAITSMIEPLLDVSTGAFHPIEGQPSVFTFMGRGIPPWVVICYAIYYGGFGSLNLIAFNKGVTQRGVWLWFLAPLLGDVLLEETMLFFKLYYYYGNQPLVLLQFPLYQPAGNSVGELIGVTILFFMRPLLTSGWRWFGAAALVMPLGGVMGFNAVCWPGFYAVHSTWSNVAVQACGLLTFALAALFVYVVSLLVATDSPLRKTGKLVLG